MKAKQLILAVGVWYFLISQFNSFTQVGPFATLTACQNYQARIIAENGAGTQNINSCFSTTSKK